MLPKWLPASGHLRPLFSKQVYHQRPSKRSRHLSNVPTQRHLRLLQANRHYPCGAYGFKALFAEIKKKDEKPIRDRIKKYLGGNTAYYRYHHGKRLLSPDQQEWILALFRQHGYTEELHFDGYRDIYDFIWIHQREEETLPKDENRITTGRKWHYQRMEMRLPRRGNDITKAWQSIWK